jgi:outer membrane protein assembly factor BamB
VVWTASSGSAFASYGNPVIAEGNVYASVVGDPDELFAYAAGTGARRWSTNFAPSAP